MISGITTAGPYMQVNNGSNPTPYFPNNYSSQGVGNMRYNTQTNNIEVYDGSSWQILQKSFASVGLSHEGQTLLDWAKEKRDQELKFKDLLEKHPGVKDLKEKLDIMVALVTEQAKQGE